MPCDPLITDDFVFPRRAANRAALPRIAYRVGRYADFVDAMTRGIDAAPALAGWTHREAGDPGIALLEGAALLGDILSFYQEHYANEAYLRTAAWRDSVAELVRLTGYRLAPGIGGRATLAFQVKGALPVTVRSGFPVKLDLADADPPVPADFETDAALQAWPHLSNFHLYRARSYAPGIAAGSSTIELHSVGGASSAGALDAFDLKPGDRLLLQPAEPAAALTAQQAPQTVKVKTVTRLLGRVTITLESPLADGWTLPVQAWRVGRTFRHLGHNAPAKTVGNRTDAGGTITGAFQADTRFTRHVHAGHDCANTSASLTLAPTLLPLDQEVADLLAGSFVAVQAVVGGVALSVTRRIAGVRGASVAFGNVTAAATLLTLDAPLIRQSTPTPLSDVRDWRIHELTSPALRLQPVSQPPGGAFASGTQALRFHGTAREARALAGRRLHLSHADGRSAALVVTSAAGTFPLPAGTAPDAPRMWPLSFDRAPTPFTRADFDEEAPTVTVFGNLDDASQGHTEHEAVLGNGDGRQRWQTFALPKAPLTYTVSAAGVPPQTPALQVWVGGRLWDRVDSFFNRGPLETVYTVREDADGRSFVQFGDGKTGARLPSGIKNVVARYRTGSGAHGPLKAGATPTASERPAGFDKVALAGSVSGGAAPESAARAREAAPGKVQSLGRLVSIADHETETLGVPGVVLASAAWDLHQGVPAVVLRVLLAAGREAEFAAVRAAIAHAQRCRGPDRHPLVVQQALPRYAFCDISVAHDPAHRQDTVDAAIRSALGLAGDSAGDSADNSGGLFGLRARRLGAREYASRIEGTVQNVAGVLWCKVTALGLFAAGAANPAALPLPAAPRALAAVLPCRPHELLQLAPRHLSLAAVAAPSAGECA